MHEGVEITGLFDIAMWTPEKFTQTIQVKTQNGQVGRPADKDMLSALICSRGGFDRLDTSIASFRGKMLLQLQKLLNSLLSENHPGAWNQKSETCKRQDEWEMNAMRHMDNRRYESTNKQSVKWDHFQRWAEAMEVVNNEFNAGIQTKGEVVSDDKGTCFARDECQITVYGNCYGLPLGRDSFPYGLPFYFYEYTKD